MVIKKTQTTNQYKDDCLFILYIIIIFIYFKEFLKNKILNQLLKSIVTYVRTYQPVLTLYFELIRKINLHCRFFSSNLINEILTLEYLDQNIPNDTTHIMLRLYVVLRYKNFYILFLRIKNFRNIIPNISAFLGIIVERIES